MSGFDELAESIAKRTAGAMLEATREELRAVVREELEAILDARDRDQVGGLAKLAEWIGAPGADAARKRLERDPELAALAIKTAGSRRRFRRSEVLGLLSFRKAAAR